VDDSVAVDAKRILLRYGAPIAVLEKVTERDRITLAREIARTPLAKREKVLKQLLIDKGYMKAAEKGPTAKGPAART